MHESVLSAADLSPAVSQHRVGAGGETTDSRDGAQWQRHPRYCPCAGRQPDDRDEHPQKKAPALHSVNPTLGSARDGSPSAVVIHQVKEAEPDEMRSFVGSKKHPRWLW